MGHEKSYYPVFLLCHNCQLRKTARPASIMLTELSNIFAPDPMAAAATIPAGVGVTGDSVAKTTVVGSGIGVCVAAGVAVVVLVGVAVDVAVAVGVVVGGIGVGDSVDAGVDVGGTGVAVGGTGVVVAGRAVAVGGGDVGVAVAGC